MRMEEPEPGMGRIVRMLALACVLLAAPGCGTPEPASPDAGGANAPEDRETLRHVHRAEAFLEASTPAFAMRECEAGLARAPEEPALLVLLGEACLSAGAASGAIERLVSAAARPEAPPRLRLVTARCLRQLGRSSEAASLLEPVVDDPHAEAPRVLAEIYYDLHEDEKAAAAFQRAIAKEPRDAELWITLGILQERMGRSEDAERSYLAALDIEPGAPATHKLLAELYELRGRNAESAGHFHTYLELLPEALDQVEIEARIEELEGKGGSQQPGGSK